MLARRLQVARLLMNGYTYEDIEKEMKVINTTIAKVQTWLNLYGDVTELLWRGQKSGCGKEQGAVILV